MSKQTKDKSDKQISNEWLAEKFADSMGYTGKKREEVIAAYIESCN